MKASPILCGLVALNSLYGFVEQEINEKAPLTVTLSESSHNRVIVDQGSIEKIVGDETLFSCSIDRSTGQAYITVSRPIHESPKTLTIVTSGGFVQDLEIITRESPSEVILLKEIQEAGEELLFKPDEFHSHTIGFLTKILEGDIPMGYGKREAEEIPPLLLPSPLQVHPVRRLEGPFEMLNVYQLVNRGKKRLKISSEQLKQNEDQWVFLTNSDLERGERAFCIISKLKSENQ